MRVGLQCNILHNDREAWRKRAQLLACHILTLEPIRSHARGPDAGADQDRPAGYPDRVTRFGAPAGQRDWLG
jgi:hypothetical protein